MKYVVWLDDLRDPKNYIKNEKCVIWCRNYNKFIYIIKRLGVDHISYISFDHDLGESSDLDGYNCAKWLVEYCMDRNIPLPQYKVHSMNPVGKKNIEKLLENYKKYYDKSSI